MGAAKRMKNNNITFGKWEAIALLLNTVGSRVFLNFPRNLAENSGNAAWIQIIYGTILAFIAFMIIEKLYAKFEGKDILDIAAQAGGNPGRILAGTILIAQIIYINSVILREYTENMKIVALTISPVGFISAFFIVGAIIAAYAGIEAIVRFHAITVPIVAIAYSFIQIGVLPYFDMTNFYPILGNGPEKIFISGFFTISTYAPLVILLFIAPMLKTHKNFKAVGYGGLGITAFFLILGTVIYIGVYPSYTRIEFFLPTYQLARMINFGRFFQRVESVFFIMWSATALMYLGATLYFLTYLFQKTFTLEYRKPLILPFAMLLLNVSFLPSSSTSAIQLEGHYGYFSWAISFGMTMILLIIAGYRHKSPKGGKVNSE